jgi:hypothetical protein
MMVMTEKELKQTFGVRVKHPLGMINYRAIEVSIQGIEREIEKESIIGRRNQLLKIRKSMKLILNEL